MPHGHCYLWRPDILWLHIISDVIIATAYFVIPIGLFIIFRSLKDNSARWSFVMFGLFIVFCGLTHLFSIVTIWKPYYLAEGILKAATAAISIATAFLFAPVVFAFVRNQRDKENSNS